MTLVRSHRSLIFALLSHFSAEIGDFDDVQSRQHLLNNKYIPEQDALADKIIDYHRKHGWALQNRSSWLHKTTPFHVAVISQMSDVLLYELCP